MSDFDTGGKQVTAAKVHKCVYCGEQIFIGERHYLRTGRHDEAWFRDRWHEECWNDTSYEEDEFLPYSQERPTK